MDAYNNLFSSINSCNMNLIFMGKYSPLDVHGKGSIEMIDGIIDNVLYVPNISLIYSQLMILQIMV